MFLYRMASRYRLVRAVLRLSISPVAFHFLEHDLIERSAFDLSRSSLLLCHINIVVLRAGMRIADVVIE